MAKRNRLSRGWRGYDGGQGKACVPGSGQPMSPRPRPFAQHVSRDLHWAQGGFWLVVA